jgi:hypothetical protein
MISAFMPIAFVHRWTHLERGWMLAVPTVANAVVYEGSTRATCFLVAGRVSLWAYDLVAR